MRKFKRVYSHSLNFEVLSNDLNLFRFKLRFDYTMENNAKALKNEGEPCEIADQFILRLPPVQAEILSKALKKRSKTKKFKKLCKICLDTDKKDIRGGYVMIKKEKLHAKLVNLPSIVESHKTVDKVHFFKTGDISQMLICKQEEFDSDDEEYTSIKNGVAKVNKKFRHPHGISPPLKNVSKQRFRKVLRCKEDLEEVAAIGKEVLYLLREDNEAVSTRFEIFYDTTNVTPTELSLFGGEISDSDDDKESISSKASNGECK